MGRKREIPPHPRRVVLVPKDPKELEPALFAELERLHRRYEKGHPEALLHAVDLVLRHYALGSWFTEAYAQRFETWCRWETPDLAKAFGVKRDNKRAPDMRRREDLRWPIVSSIVEYRRQGKSTEEAVEQTAADFRVSEAFASNLYRASSQARKIIENLPTLHFRLVQDGPKLHKKRKS
jgi:hypothetical protein